MRTTFDNQLKELNDSLILMGAQCEDCVTCATQALLTGEKTLGDRAIQLEKDIDVKEREIQSLCMKLLLQQQPVARDLRTISAALKMITDMERIGDQGSDIAELLNHTAYAVSTANNPSESSDGSHIAAMADAVIRMVTGSVNAFVRQDASLAKEVASMDDEVDTLFQNVKSDILDMITSGVKHNRALGERALDTLMIAKYLERVGDHAVNITEWVRFSMGEEIHAAE
jgi:phosphate transport system protein